MNRVLNMKHNSPTFRLVTKPLQHANTHQDGYSRKRSRFSAACLIGSLVGLITTSLFSLDAAAAGACSPYMGNATLNEYAHQQRFVEVRQLNTSQSFTNWKVRVYTSVPANTTTCGSGCAEAALPASGANLCGNYQVLPFGSLATTANAVLLDENNDVVDIVRLTTGGSVTSIYPKPSCSGYVGPSTDLVNVSSAQKGIDRLPDGYGAWRNTPGTGSGSFVTPCGVNAPNSATSANLGLTKAVTSGASITVGQTATFLLTVSNAGPDTATNLQIRDTLPSGLSYLSNTTPTAGTFNASTMIWDVPLLANGQSQTLSITVTGTSAGSQINTAVVASDNADSNPANNTATATVTVASSVDHYELTVPANSVSCLASTVTVTACTAAATASACTSKATNLSGQSATLATNAGTLGATTVTFNASGDATTTLSHAAAANLATATVTLSGEMTGASAARRCCNGSTCATGDSCTTTFNTAGFIVANAVGGSVYTVPTQTAGTTSTSSTGNLILRAVKTNSTTQACESALVGTTTVNWLAQCNNPTTCSSGSRMSLSGALSTAAGSSPIAGNANGSTASSTAVSMTFDANGNAPFSFNYADVGQVTLFASKAASGSLLTSLSGSSTFVVKPGGFTVTGIQQTASPFLANPAATNASGSRFVKAGESFSATVTATTSTGVATPNYGRETTPEGVLLTRALVAPVGGATGALSNGTIAGSSFSSGVATVTNLSWSEVGIISLTPSVADADYLGAGNTTGAAVPNVGRFVPHHFDTALVKGCAAGNFTYSGQPFAAQLTPKNLAGAITQNYNTTCGFSKLVTLSNAGSVVNVNVGWPPPGPATQVMASTQFTNPATCGGVLNPLTGPGGTQANVTYTLASATGPSTFTLRGVDADGVTSSGATEGTTAVRSGRMRLVNAYGSELLDLPMTLRAEYWNGAGWIKNTDDNCTGDTSAAAANAVAVTLTQTLSPATCVWDTGAPGRSGAGCSVVGPTSPTDKQFRKGTFLVTGPGLLQKGDFNLWLKAPTSAGTVAVNVDVPPWLEFPWVGVGSTDPSARATFGVFKSPLIYRRENY
jgi:uncharacterized repeat protein (TIGR01451 family)